MTNERIGQNLIIFGVDMSSSIHVDNKKKHGTTLTAEKKYSINFTESKKKLLFKLAL